MRTRTDSQEEIESIRQTLESLRNSLLTREAEMQILAAAEALESLQQRLNATEEHSQLAALYRVSQVLGTSLEIDEVLNQVMDAVIELTGAERGFLILSNPDAEELNLRAARNFERENLAEKSMEVSRTVIRTVLESGTGVVTTNAQKDPRFLDKSSVINFALRSIICAPLLSRGKTIGVIYVDNRALAGLFQESDLSLLNTFAAQAAVVIENARLFTRRGQTLAERVAELERLSTIDHQLTDQLDLDHVLELTEQWTRKGTRAEKATIALFNPDRSKLIIAAGPEKGTFLDPTDPFIADALAGESSLVSWPGLDGRRAKLLVPIRHAGQPIGALIVESRRELSEHECEFLIRLVSRAGSAIENARLYQAVQEANQAKSKFVSVVSHELRLPMTSIKGYADLLLQGAAGSINESQNNFLHVIRNNVERMRVLVSDLSDISRIETGRLQLAPVPLSLHGHIDQALGSLRPKIEEKNQSLHVNVAEDLPRAMADPNRLMQILANLISNAWKYTPEGGRIDISAKEQDGHLYIEVVDNGIGISPEDQLRIFSQFFRSEDDDVREQQGWGLGLHVTRQLVELMGGEIGMHSELDQGSTFWFTLPAAGPGAAAVSST